MREFSIIDHTADTGIDCRADSIEELFRSAAEGLRYILLGDVDIRCKITRKLELNSESTETLIREWLAELLYLFESDGFIPVKCEFDCLGSTDLVAHLSGEMYDPKRHRVQTEVKAITWHELRVECGGDGIYRARAIFDL